MSKSSSSIGRTVRRGEDMRLRINLGEYSGLCDGPSGSIGAANRCKAQATSVGLPMAWDQDPTRRRLSIGSARTAASPGSSPSSPFRRTSVRRMMRL